MVRGRSRPWEVPLPANSTELGASNASIASWPWGRAGTSIHLQPRLFCVMLILPWCRRISLARYGAAACAWI